MAMAAMAVMPTAYSGGQPAAARQDDRPQLSPLPPTAETKPEDTRAAGGLFSGYFGRATTPTTPATPNPPAEPKPEERPTTSLFPKSFYIYNDAILGEAAPPRYNDYRTGVVIGTSPKDCLYHAFTFGRHIGVRNLKTTSDVSSLMSRPESSGAYYRNSCLSHSAYIVLQQFPPPHEVYFSEKQLRRNMKPRSNRLKTSSRLKGTRTWSFDFDISATGEEERFLWTRTESMDNGYGPGLQLTRAGTGEVIATYESLCSKEGYKTSRTTNPEGKFEFVSEADLGGALELMVVNTMLFIVSGLMGAPRMLSDEITTEHRCQSCCCQTCTALGLWGLLTSPFICIACAMAP